MIKKLLPLTLALLFCAGCVTSKKCLDKFGQDTFEITVLDTVPVTVAAPIPPDSVEGEITPDSLNMLLTGQIDSLTNVSESKDLYIKFWRDKFTNALRYKANAKRDTIYVTKEVPVEVIADCPPVVVVTPDEPKGWAAKLWKKFQFFAPFLVLGETIILLFLFALKRRA